MIIKEISPLDSFGGDAGLLSNCPEARAAARRAGRAPIGMWDLMLWAFNNEKVRFSCGTDFAAKSSHSSLANAIAAGLSGVVLGADGGGYQPPSCHDDALEVFLAVSAVIGRARRGHKSTSAPKRVRYGFGELDAAPHTRELAPLVSVVRGDGQTVLKGRAGLESGDEDARNRARRLLIDQTEKAKAPPVWDVDVSRAKACVGKFRPNGKPVHEVGTKKHGKLQNTAVACLVRYEGFTPEEAESLRCAARAVYAEWCALLRAVIHEIEARGDGLTRWRINGLGVSETPWADAPRRGGLTRAGKNLTVRGIVVAKRTPGG